MNSERRTGINRAAATVVKPFRWDVSKPEQIGDASGGWPCPFRLILSDDVLRELQRCCAQVLARCQDSDLVFVGRSPESLFDHLCGALHGTSWAERCALLLFSMRYLTCKDARRQMPAGVSALRSYFSSLGLAPRQLLTRLRPVAFVDLVAYGSTFANLAEFLLAWGREMRVDQAALCAKVRFVGIVARQKTSPKTWRWQQHARWTQHFGARAIRNVSIPWRLWCYLGNDQEKLAQSYYPGVWGDASLLEPPRGFHVALALQVAQQVYDHGRTPAGRQQLVHYMQREDGMRFDWFRGLALELRRVPETPPRRKTVSNERQRPLLVDIARRPWWMSDHKRFAEARREQLRRQRRAGSRRRKLSD